MGVINLWSILDPIAKEQPLTYLEGKTVAVDLGVWVVQSQLQGGLKSSGKPHLKILFYRVKYLLTHNVYPIFVCDGKPPKVKENTIRERNIKNFSTSHNSNYDGGTGNRETYLEYLNECDEMLKALGVPCLKSVGEAESFCAYLNSEGFVDGCITEDSDAFIYGAKTVIRDFSISPPSQKLKVYELTDIKQEFGLNRKKFIALALLLGSDYNKGISGIGKEAAMNMIKEVEGIDILERFADYASKSESELFPSYKRELDGKLSHCQHCGHPGTYTTHKKEGCDICKCETDCLSECKMEACLCSWHKNLEAKRKIKHELKIYEKVKAFPKFPDATVIDEYSGNLDILPCKEMLMWECPNLHDFQMKQFLRLRWPWEKSDKEILPIITSWQMTQICKNPDFVDVVFNPVRIIKECIKDRRNLYEVSWQRKDAESISEDDSTFEFVELFSKVYPNVTDEFKKTVATKKKSPKKLSSPSKTKGSASDLVKNAKIDEFFPSVKKRRTEPKTNLQKKFEVVES